MKKYYIIYEVVKNEKGDILDLRNCYDNENSQIVCEWLKISYNHLGDYTAKDIDKINCRLKDNKYFIFKDYE